MRSNIRRHPACCVPMRPEDNAEPGKKNVVSHNIITCSCIGSQAFLCVLSIESYERQDCIHRKLERKDVQRCILKLLSECEHSMNLDSTFLDLWGSYSSL